ACRSRAGCESRCCGRARPPPGAARDSAPTRSAGWRGRTRPSRRQRRCSRTSLRVDPPGDSSTGPVGSVELPAPGRVNQLRWLNVTGHSSGLETITLMISRSLLSSPKGVTSELSHATAIGPTGCDHPSGRYGCAESVLLLVMPKQREQNDDRNWDA